MSEALLGSLGRYIPECVIAVSMMFLIFLEAAYRKDENDKSYMYIAAAVGCVVTFVVLILNMKMPSALIFKDALAIDSFGSFAKITMVISTLGIIYLCRESKDIYANMKGEFLILIFIVLIGGMVLTSANNFLTMYLGIEILSITSYALASFKKVDDKSSEAGLKYVLYGGISSGVMLFGISHIFGVLGTIQFTEITPMLETLTTWQTNAVIASFVLFFVGLGYKLTCVPFHMWSPDVYEGSPIPVTAFFSLVPKIAAIAALVRINVVFFGDVGVLKTSWMGLLTVMSALTMTVGNISAIDQRSVKRMLAFSSIGHAGVLIMGATVVDQIAYKSILFYALSYVFMTLVAFFVTSFVADQYGNDHMDRFSGLIKKHPFAAICMGISLLSLAGIPPFSGFIAKFNIIAAVIAEGNYTLAIIAALNSVISVYYYLKLVRVMMLKDAESESKISNLGFLNQLIIVIVTVPIVALGIFWEKIIVIANNSSLF